MAFARAVADRVEMMKSTRSGVPELPATKPTAFEIISSDDWPDCGSWDFAGLAPFYEYLRGCKYVKIPEEYKPFFPKKLWAEDVGVASWRFDSNPFRILWKWNNSSLIWSKVLLFESLVLIFDVENFGFEFLKNRTRIEPV